MVLIRIIVLKGLMDNVRIFAKHVKGISNGLADSLSRNKIDSFHQMCKKEGRILNEVNEAVPSPIWPIEKIWKF